jgi:hypothetical protein
VLSTWVPLSVLPLLAAWYAIWTCLTKERAGIVKRAASVGASLVIPHFYDNAVGRDKRMGGGIRRPVPVRIFDVQACRFETIEAVNDTAAKELVGKINAEKGAARYAYIPVRQTPR